METAGITPARFGKRQTAAFEVAVVLGCGLTTVGCVIAIFGTHPAASIGAVWLANMLMIGLVYGGLRLRGQGWSHFGLTTALGRWQSCLRGFLYSIPVFVFAIAAFVLAAIVMANIVGMPKGADMSKYDDLRGNLTMTILALLSVYFVSSFAEEVIYRGFMITRISEAAGEGRGACWLAVLVSSAVFGFVHSDWGIAGMVQASFMGVALGVSYLIVRRSLWVTILAHAYMDTILVLQMYFASPP